MQRFALFETLPLRAAVTARTRVGLSVHRAAEEDR